MKFQIKFQINRGGKRYKVTWEDGTLKGNPVVVEIVKTFINSSDGVIDGLRQKKDPISDPLFFLTMAQEEFYKVRAEGEIPLLSNQDGII